eukprot:gnl/TRDRNA2_/TRDRNA2_177735_c1_seq14.p1 gnl/TRDRNA2_/TRDRNA2_177735_c1~~gnl/TRDRNA2_/TRDRNA2_177735_c1_seq14.p1  ORF type:complete len:700 (+),score=286.78 gnl/TRDRNA2_/TRDRNA2_177735_c1_seq14:74-2173(+)
MKASTSVLLLLGLAAFVPSAQASVLSSSINPVTRVVELLKGLAQKTEEEGKKEEDMYETYVCWAKTVITTKTESNKAAKSRIDSLEAFVADLDAGRIDLTGEGGDLAKEVGQLRSDMETAKALRDKEHDDFKAAKKEMEQGIAALEKAVDVLKEATKDSKGSLLRVKGKATEGFQQRVAESKVLKQAVDYSKKVLSAGDARFLEHLLTGEVPHALVSKPGKDFKMKYKMRSGKIQDLLAKMLSTFKTNLKDATDKEDQTQKEYDDLMEAKTAQKAKTEDALSGMEAETGARGQAKEESQTELDALTKQVEADKKFIENTIADLANKKEEWKDRKSLRAGEIAAVGKAIGILTSDEARDLFRSSGNFLFMQESSKVGTRFGLVRREASRVVNGLAHKTKDGRLALLATKMISGGHFDEVIKAIDDMIDTLKKEEEADIENKETCEKDRMTNSRTAVKTARTIDELSDSIMKLEAEIADITQEIADKNDTIEKITKEMAEATEQRKQEKLEFERSTEDDTNARKLVLSAKDVLEGFYKDNGLMQLNLLQKGKQAPPPPPPQTFDAPYGGAKGESTGIVTMMEIIAEDIQKDIDAATKAEKEAVEEYEATKKEFEEQKAELLADIETLDGEKGDKMQSVEDNKGERKTQKGELDAVMQTMTDALPNCDFIAINFPMRMKNRQTEIDGLDKAKGILKGAAFGL